VVHQATRSGDQDVDSFTEPEDTETVSTEVLESRTRGGGLEEEEDERKRTRGEGLEEED